MREVVSGLGRDAKQWGAYYTSGRVASYLADWAIRTAEDRVLEPSFGDGVFLRAAKAKLASLGGSFSTLYGVELHQETFRQQLDQVSLEPENSYQQDFLALKPFRVDTVIGNPPYIRLRNLTKEAAKRAQKVTACHGVHMQSSGSLWMPFVVHSAAFLNPGGRLALVLPFELTYVSYALPLWQWLASSFGQISVIRAWKNLFPENDVETVLLLADQFGGSTEHVNYLLHQDTSTILAGKALRQSRVPVQSILNGERPFAAALVPEAVELIRRLQRQGKVRPLHLDCKFKIGYVSGDKQFFHPRQETIDRFGLPERSLHRAVFNSRQLRGQGVTLADAGGFLYLPGELDAGDRSYIAYGEQSGVSQRYKCKVRNPWYVVPGGTPPDLIVSVFADQPILVTNPKRFLASNSLLCGYLQGGQVRASDIALRWYTSLTWLSIELKVHSLGGGVLVMIPGEVDGINAPVLPPRLSRGILLQDLDQLLREGNVTGAYEAGDAALLRAGLGLSVDEIALLHASLNTLQSWRRRTGCRR
jgi:hypothetical protein